MIDHHARNTLAEIIRHFLSGLTDNFMFDDAAFAIKTRDVAVIEIRQQMWHIYDDFQRHNLKGIWTLSEEDVSTVHRFVLFLKTDFKGKKPTKDTDMDIWPFNDLQQYKMAITDPKYLNNPT